MTSSDNTKLISLTQGKFTIVDVDDYEHLNQWKWHINNSGYASRKPYDKTTGTNPINILMHRIIMKISDNALVDHINLNPLDNRKSNLRICTKSQNAMNSYKKKNCSSVYKGVSWDTKRELWKARLKIDYTEKYLGRFSSELEAALAYNNAAIKYFGEFAKLNKIDQ